MEVPGRVQHGVIVLEGGVSLPEGVPVIVSYPAASPSQVAEKRRVHLPLVHTGEPGSVNLSGERIAEILDEEDLSPRR
jgi:hypothetical protein